MSSLFGILTTGSMLDNKGLTIWNKLYGQNTSEKSIDNTFYIGCNLSSFSSHPHPSCPILIKDNFIAAIDCVIYNRNELLSETGDSELTSDEQLLFNIFLKKGLSALKDINGDFAGAIYNTKTRTLSLFRDHSGIRPLFYFFDGKQVVFSSDIRGIISNKSLTISIREEWAYKVLAGHSTLDAVKTEYNNVFRVEAATLVSFSFDNTGIQISVERYWAPATKKIKLSSQKQYQEKLRDLITDAIKIRLDAYPGTVASELSGGLDSSVISILINRLGRKGVYISWSKPIDTCPIEVAWDERNIIQTICEQEKFTCHYNSYDFDGYTKDLQSVSRTNGFVIDSIDLPLLKYSLPPHINILPLLMTSICAKSNDASVIFSGHGGDEGVSHRCNEYELLYHHEFYHYFRNLWSETHGEKNRIVKTLKYFYNNLKYAKEVLRKPYKTSFYIDCFASERLQSKKKQYSFQPLYFSYDPAKYIMQGTTVSRPENAALLATYSGARYVFPYLDYRVLDYALSIPRHNFLKNGQNRYIFREAFKDILPRKLYINAPKQSVSVTSSPDDTEDWFPAFNKERLTWYNSVDKIFWKDILDFDKLEKWVNSSRPSDDEQLKQEYTLSALECLLLAQTGFTGSRLAVERAEVKEKKQSVQTISEQ